MVSIASETQYYYHPIITWDLLKRFSKGLIVTSGCLGAFIPQAILNGQDELADKSTAAFKKLFGDNFYMEVQPYGDETGHQKMVNGKVLELGKKHGVKGVMTQDSHFIRKEEEETHQLMMKMGNKTMDEATYHNRHIGNEIELVCAWQELMGDTPYSCDDVACIAETDRIADKCDLVDIFNKEEIPSLEWGEDSKTKLYNICKNGLKRAGLYVGDANKVYRDRLAYEFNTVMKKGFIDYFLLCYDLYKFARDNGIRANFGRGSVCGSLLAFAIGVTEIDPILYDIPFDTFLREDKETTPDIDMDFPRSRRGEVVAYIMRKYEGRAAQISTYGYYQVKNLANDLVKALEMSEDEGRAFKMRLDAMLEGKTSSDMDKITLRSYLMTAGALRDAEQECKAVTHFVRLYGQVRYIGMHPAGIAIATKDIDTMVPLQHSKNGLQTAFDLNDLGHIGIVKFDVLGLGTLDTVANCEKMIGKKYDIYSIRNDDAVLNDFREGILTGVFQFDSRQAKEYAYQVSPQTDMDIFALNGINRPGPLAFGYLDKYAERLLDGVDRADIPSYEMEIAPDTYGVFLYSDHIIKLCLWAGLDRQETDKLIKAVSKKTIGQYKGLQDKMLAGLKGRGLSDENAQDMFDCLSLYGFKKAHAVGYGLFSYYTAYLKHYHPVEYYCALLMSEEKEVKRIEYELDALNSGVSIMIATVNSSSDYQVVTDKDGDKWIQKGISSIAGIGPVAARSIIEMGPYESAGHMRSLIPKRQVNERAYDVLEKAGALVFDDKDIVELSRRYCKTLYQKLKQARAKARNGK